MSAVAIKWFRKSAEQSYSPAQFNLGIMYLKGQGVPQDAEEAYLWVNLAASGASAENEKEFADARDRIAKTMTSQQLAEAQRRSREWRPQVPPRLIDPSPK